MKSVSKLSKKCWFGIYAITFLLFQSQALAKIERTVFSNAEAYLVVEFLDDDLVHFELSAINNPPSLDKPLYTSPMVKKNNYKGPSWFKRNGSTLETPDIRVVINPSDLTTTVIDKTKSDLVLTSYTPRNVSSPWKGLSITPESFTHAYGLGQKFFEYNQPNGDLIGRKRESGSQGNVMSGWDGGATGDTQIPVVYFAAEGKNSYGMFMDNFYKQTWDFTQTPWTADMWGDWLRWYVMTGDDLQDIRKDYMELTGTPPVPPKQAFGLWVSEFGFDNWEEVDSKLSSLKQQHFPVDGFILDLQWFGGITGDDNTQMGSLTWDTEQFPEPAKKIKELKQREGIGMVVIEEPTIGKNLPAHEDLANRGFLAQDRDGLPIYLDYNPWWGKGGYIDLTNPDARSYWHQLKREPLIDDGIMGHWTDLGEPELYDTSATYYGITGDYRPLRNHGDIHNLYGFFWSQSIYEGYQQNNRTARPWILGRSGASGVQRYGVLMWSGDIGGNLTSLNTQLNAQMHMSMSGVDYYGSDVGGFRRQHPEAGYADEVYTVWFAHSSLLEVPIRPHVANLCNCEESSPDRIGNVQTNLENLRFRYQHGPYYYSLAHRAYEFAEPIFPPLVYYFQEDLHVREMGDQKMIGKDLMVKTASEHGVAFADVYLPAGDWFNYRTNRWYRSSGNTLTDVSTLDNGLFKLPIFARSGSIIPQSYVDEQTSNSLGLRRDHSQRNELLLTVFPDANSSEFVLYEDNGHDISYASGEVRKTTISQNQQGKKVTVSISKDEGRYEGMITKRENIIKLVTKNESVKSVSLNGWWLKRYYDKASFESARRGWYHEGDNVFLAKSGEKHTNRRKKFVFLML